MIKKLAYPSFFDVTPVQVFVTDGIDRYGEEKIVDTYIGKCNYSEATKRVQNSEGLWIHLSGVIHIKGDIFPNQSKVSGYVLLNGQKMIINSCTRPRNPDGTVNHTRLELL